MASLSNPAVFSQVRQGLIDQGFKPADIERALSQRVASEQAPQAFQEGLLSKEAAFEAAGGGGSPGAFDMRK